MKASVTPEDPTLLFYSRNSERFIRAADAADLSRERNTFIQELRGKSVLDAGCGSGRDAAVFASLGMDIFAIDASPEMIAATRAKGVDATLMRLQDINKDDQFDGIWCCASLLHIPRSEMKDVLFLLTRSLKSDGVLFISVKKGDGEAVAPDGRFFNYFSEEELSASLQEVGLATIHIETISGTDSSAAAVAWINYLGRKTGR